MSVEQFFVFLRAINTGGRRLTNEALVAPFAALGFDDVAAYQAAGNVAFRADAGGVEEDVIEAAVTDAYGFDTPVFVRTAEQVKALDDGLPFTEAQVAWTAGKVQVGLLKAAPGEAKKAAVAALVPSDDVVAVVGRELYWLPKVGISDSALPVKAIEGVLGSMTIRTLGTLQRMTKKFCD